MKAMLVTALVVTCGAVSGSLLRAEQAATTTADAKTTWSGVYSEAQAKRGADVYTTNCVSCHGQDLAGADQAPPLTGGDFTANWNDLSLNDLFERIRISMPADHPGTLSRTDVADVLAFLLSRGNFPAGASDLPADGEALKAIKFVAAKP